ncbi:hypothetical protein, partial [uncultured Campylobacter sp.]|uniref:hypothetical protein n=1 Tax=uncultured Campylobacter sp. TaxID=218934 RepID=UPI00260BB7C4
PLRRNFKLRVLNLSLNLGRASHKFKAWAKFKLASLRYFYAAAYIARKILSLARRKNDVKFQISAKF